MNLNLISCLKCGSVFNKSKLVENWIKQNEKIEYLQRSDFFNCPVCKERGFNLHGEEVQE